MLFPSFENSNLVHARPFVEGVYLSSASARSNVENGALSKFRTSYIRIEAVACEAIAMTLAEGSKAARYGVTSLSLPCGLLELRSHRQTVSSSQQDRNWSFPGDSAMHVTCDVCAVKYRT